jgi:hypothetical protein
MKSHTHQRDLALVYIAFILVGSEEYQSLSLLKTPKEWERLAIYLARP